VYGLLDSCHILVLVHIVLGISLAFSCLPWVWAFSSKVSGAIAVVAFSDSLGAGVMLGWSFYLSDVSPEVLLIRPVQGEVSSGEVHRDGDIVHGSWGV
jgi:hypothetical protein